MDGRQTSAEGYRYGRPPPTHAEPPPRPPAAPRPRRASTGRSSAGRPAPPPGRPRRAPGRPAPGGVVAGAVVGGAAVAAARSPEPRRLAARLAFQNSTAIGSTEMNTIARITSSNRFFTNAKPPK